MLKSIFGMLQIKIETSTPSKVVHLRGLPNEVSEGEVIQLGMNYGKVTNILMLKVGLLCFCVKQRQSRAI